MTVMVIGYLIFISTDFTILLLCFLLSFSFDLEDISNSQDMTTFPNTLKFVKYTLLRFVFPTLFSVFGNVVKQVKQSLSCLIYFARIAQFRKNGPVDHEFLCSSVVRAPKQCSVCQRS